MVVGQTLIIGVSCQGLGPHHPSCINSRYISVNLYPTHQIDPKSTHSNTSDSSSPRCSLSAPLKPGRPGATSPRHWKISDSSPTCCSGRLRLGGDGCSSRLFIGGGHSSQQRQHGGQLELRPSTGDRPSSHLADQRQQQVAGRVVLLPLALVSKLGDAGARLFQGELGGREG